MGFNLFLHSLVGACGVMSSFFVYSTEMVFCYEDKELPPSYMGNGLVVPKERPGAAIEILRRADKLLESISIKYVRKPWQRCLYELKKNKIDAVIASYTSIIYGFSFNSR